MTEKNEILPVKKAKYNAKNDGHRKRLKERYINTGFDSFSDHEVIELMLFYAIPYSDTKGMAKAILEEFGNIRYLFEATVEEISTRCNVSSHVAIMLSLAFSSYKIYLKSSENFTALNSTSAVHRYLQVFFAGQKVECFYIICMDQKKKLIKPCLISKGSTTSTQIYIRNIVEAVIKSDATKVILAHNHPSGHIEPSSSDIEATSQITRVLHSINVDVVDHIIISDNDFFSFYKNNLLSM